MTRTTPLSARRRNRYVVTLDGGTLYVSSGKPTTSKVQFAAVFTQAEAEAEAAALGGCAVPLSDVYAPVGL